MILDTNHTVEIPEGIALCLPVAGPIERMLAFLLDLIIRGAILYVINLILSFMGVFGHGLLLIIYFIVDWLYAILFEVLNQGATPGKKALNISVINDDGTPVNWASSIVRNLLRVVDALPLFYTCVSDSQATRKLAPHPPLLSDWPIRK